jgi:hypothetical protein
MFMPKRMTYKEILDSVDKVGGYLTDPIGKCLRTTTKRGKTFRIDLDYSGSKTFAAFKQRVHLSSGFNPKRAKHAYLIWVEVPQTGEMSGLPILVDYVSGLIKGTNGKEAGQYGCLDDVGRCIHVTIQA